MSTDVKLAELRADWIARASEDYDGLLSQCESPIERLFLAALLCGYETENGLREPWRALVGQNEWSVVRALAKASHGISPNRMFVAEDEGVCSNAELGLVLAVQVDVVTVRGKHRLDFAIFHRDARVAVELDGHDFHEKTKAQARSDKSRDRALTLAGWRVIRFTGSEIYADPHRCVDEAIELARSLYVPRMRSR